MQAGGRGFDSHPLHSLPGFFLILHALAFLTAPVGRVHPAVSGKGGSDILGEVLMATAPRTRIVAATERVETAGELLRWRRAGGYLAASKRFATSPQFTTFHHASM